MFPHHPSIQSKYSKYTHFCSKKTREIFHRLKNYQKSLNIAYAYHLQVDRQFIESIVSKFSVVFAFRQVIWNAMRFPQMLHNCTMQGTGFILSISNKKRKAEKPILRCINPFFLSTTVCDRLEINKRFSNLINQIYWTKRKCKIELTLPITDSMEFDNRRL